MSEWCVLKTVKHLGFGRFRTKRIKPVAHAYYWILDGNGGYFKSFCGSECAAKNGLLPAFDTVSVCVSCREILDRPRNGHLITVAEITA